jgi:hypothetical protein
VNRFVFDIKIHDAVLSETVCIDVECECAVREDVRAWLNPSVTVENLRKLQSSEGARIPAWRGDSLKNHNLQGSVA